MQSDRAARVGHPSAHWEPPESAGDSRHRSRTYQTPDWRIGLIGTYALTITNPLTILGFLGFSGQLRYSGEGAPVLYLSIAVFAGSLFIQTVFAVFSHGLRRVVKNPAIIRYLNFLGGAIVIGFGIVGLLTALDRLRLPPVR